MPRPLSNLLPYLLSPNTLPPSLIPWPYPSDGTAATSHGDAPPARPLLSACTAAACGGARAPSQGVRATALAPPPLRRAESRRDPHVAPRPGRAHAPGPRMLVTRTSCPSCPARPPAVAAARPPGPAAAHRPATPARPSLSRPALCSRAGPSPMPASPPPPRLAPTRRSVGPRGSARPARGMDAGPARGAQRGGFRHGAMRPAAPPACCATARGPSARHQESRVKARRSASRAGPGWAGPVRAEPE